MSDGKTGEFQPSTPGGFVAGASAALAPAAGGINESKKAAEGGKLKLSQDGADAMLAKLAELKSRSDELIGKATDLDEPLKFGDNWVGELMNERFRGAVAGGNGSVRNVLRSYRQVLDEVEATVRAAAGRYADLDELLAGDFHRIGGADASVQRGE